MFSHYNSILNSLNDDSEGLDSEHFRDKLLTLPVELWGQILWKTKAVEQYGRLASLAPDLPSIAIQSRFAGGSGEKLLQKNADYIRVFEAGVASSLAQPLRNLRILDYGCGWGRLTRYFLRYCGPGDLVAADPDKPIIDELIRENFPAEIKLIKAIPDDGLNFGQKFDVINLFSIFTHLPDWLLKTIMEQLRAIVNKKSVVVFTVRSPEFWPFYRHAMNDDRFEIAGQQHKARGYTFVPLRVANGLESANFGDSGFGHEYLLELISGWSVVKTEVSSGDPFQVIYFVRPR